MSDSIPRITEIRAIPIHEPHPGVSFSKATNEYTLLEVKTDAGVSGIGSCYTSTDLVNGALGRMERLYMGEIAIEPQRMHEKLGTEQFLVGAWWDADAYHQWYRYCAVGYFRQGDGSTGWTFAGWCIP